MMFVPTALWWTATVSCSDSQVEGILSFMVKPSCGTGSNLAVAGHSELRRLLDKAERYSSVRSSVGIVCIQLKH